ncbi:uncharacterized protein B4U79_09694 [Dinothrombium tinctorium]|uniref:Uncharacterized protein n=1 Tax=Dinothrombium tinctorium TaxID=1965070 RepID=A0A3S3PGV6_9ACAR|nr:uncharacterized protein B4U79_09694 [Dinothrombium tinctorium]
MEYEGNNYSCTFDNSNFNQIYADKYLTNRPCYKSIDTCPGDWPNETIRAKCSSFTNYVQNRNILFKNMHCAYCNGISDTIDCDIPTFGPSGRLASFSLILDFYFKDGNLVGSRETVGCLLRFGQVFNPLTQACIDFQARKEQMLNDTTTECVEMAVFDSRNFVRINESFIYVNFTSKYYGKNDFIMFEEEVIVCFIDYFDFFS